MRIFPQISDLAREQGNKLGTSNWREIAQERIDLFADATDDHQWIHTDPERCRRELDMPTIAHGYMTLSLIPSFLQDVFHVENAKRIINYGANKIRFTGMIRAGSRIRGHVLLREAVLNSNALRATFDVTVEIEGEEKPAMIADNIVIFQE